MPREIRLFDDASTDDTREKARSRDSPVNLETSPRQIGYIAARNRLLDGTDSELAVSLDDDAELCRPDSLALVADAFERFPRCGVLAFRIYWGLKLPSQTESHQEQAAPVRSFVGCGHAWRLEAWRAVRPYPEWYHFYGEEAYASLALAREGWEVRYCPDVLVHHRVDPAARPGDERWWRYRGQLRAGLLNMLTLYPGSALPRSLGRSVRGQLVKLGPLPWRRRWELARTLARVAAETPRWVRRRRPLSDSAWQDWMALPAEIIFWQPPASGEPPLAHDAQHSARTPRG